MVGTALVSLFFLALIVAFAVPRSSMRRTAIIWVIICIVLPIPVFFTARQLKPADQSQVYAFLGTICGISVAEVVAIFCIVWCLRRFVFRSNKGNNPSH
jgi:hypothetical protein